MLSSLLTLILSLILVNLAQSARVSFEPHIHYTGVTCWSSNKSLSGFKCFIKALSRTKTTVNVFVNLTRSLFDVKLRYDLSFKSIANSRRSIINSTIDVCEFLNGTAKNPVFKWIIGLAENFEEQLHACPYEGNLAFRNISSDLKAVISAFPGGNYLNILKFWSNEDNNILTIRLPQEIVSKDRKEFK